VGLTAKQRNNMFNEELWKDMFTISEVSTYECIYMFSSFDFEDKEFLDKLKAVMKDDFKEKENMVFVASDPDDKKTSDNEVREYKKFFKKLNINEFNLIDSRTSKFAAIKHIENANVVMFMSGDPLAQIKFIREYEIDGLMDGFKGIIMGVSAGSMNIANHAHCSRFSRSSDSKDYNGMGLIDITIDPHFEYKNKYMKEDVINSKIDIIGLPDPSYIRVDKYGSKTIYGEYFIKDKKTIKKTEDNPL